jgi:hypothetical protein
MLPCGKLSGCLILSRIVKISIGEMTLPKETSGSADDGCAGKGMQKCSEFTRAMNAFVCRTVRKSA